MSERALEVLCFNSGSSSLKFALFQMDRESLLMRGAVEGISLAEGQSWVQASGGEKSVQVDRVESHRDAADRVFALLKMHRVPPPGAIGHRLVHGGMRYAEPQRVNPELISALRDLTGLAPLHLPNELDVVEATAARFPTISQVVCFDTAFHRTMPELAQRFALPRHFWDDGIRRYGFHGLSYEYVLGVLGPSGRGRTILAHLGNGASLAAIKDRHPLDTTMGFTPNGGVMMGTRSGDLDPGILLYLMRAKGYSAERLDDLVQRQSGLLGVSQISSDMKILLERRDQDDRAAEAVTMFCNQVRKSIGALAAVLDGLDTLVFTGGIGERASPVRWQVCEGLSHLRVRLDAQANARHADIISAQSSACVVRVIPTDEDLMIARHVKAVLQ